MALETRKRWHRLMTAGDASDVRKRKAAQQRCHPVACTWRIGTVLHTRCHDKQPQDGGPEQSPISHESAIGVLVNLA